MANEYVVKIVTGEVFIKDETGRISRITAGQRLKDGDEIITKNGHIELEDPNGATREIAPNADVILGDAGVQETVPDDIDAKTAPEIPDKPDQRQKTDDAQQDGAPQTMEDGTAHSFVKTPRIEYKEDFNLGYGRDVNTTEELAGRATLNPRVKFAYNASITEETTSYHDPIRDFEGRRDDGWHSGEKMRPSYEELERPISTDTGINPPTPHSMAVRTLEDGFVRINPLENYERLDGFSLTAATADAAHGKVSIGADGALIYTPNPDFHGEDTITCVFHDQSNRTYTSEVSVTVGSVSDTTNDAGSTDENTPITID
ncbi:MAG: Ig-like domain-containing protein, partial [Cloacibacillus sp.]